VRRTVTDRDQKPRPPAQHREKRLAGFIEAHAGMGSFDSARPSLREVLALLRMTLLRGVRTNRQQFSSLESSSCDPEACKPVN
jgi:hypothetical protein